MPVDDPPGLAARRLALHLLDGVLRKGLPLESVLESAGRQLAKAEDRALAHAIAAEALRRLPDLDALIDRATSRRLPGDAKARSALRIALVQALVLGTPPHAAIATALPLVEGGPRRLLHGVFGTVLRKGWSLPDVPALPAPVAERWRKAWGPEVVDAAARLIAVPPPLDLIFADDPAPAGLDGVSLVPGHLRLPRGSAVAGLAGYGEGRWWVQDISASIPAGLLGPGDGRTALDLCAAPGGKTMQLASAGWRVTAVDISESRLARLCENLARTRLEAEIVAADVMSWQPSEPVDAILLDAPCSATGIFRRHPDVLHRVRPSAIGGLAEAQKAMLARAASWLKPGGTLVYSVCSLEPEEGEMVADSFLASEAGFHREEVRRILPGAWLDQGGADSFYITRFVRK
ncbi:RsmB/NOP family class I SAM-dependent RNA methyltransferase [Sphingosinicella sp. CPCC 101087]|uniref:RsmB/NOP family class I SAM-dependent RNA methyltransferase n=1 Tax=Sphingosinicella sp. CPCC 101087 TaxID=2497754 RepID=UPI00101BB867|nr:RsmB/NOP family class I SAM-dependent RNA methyltransferase [Sphingosinicella sp. CPCC 101087]